MITIKRELELILIVVFATIAYFFLFGTNRVPKNIQVQADLPVSSFTPSTVTPTPIANIFQPKITASSWNSPDGAAVVTMEEKSNQDSTNTYTFSVSSNASNTPNTPVQIFSQTSGSGTSFSIPYNTFSPDDKYLFLDETATDSAHFLVFKSTGEAFSDSENYLDVSKLFGTYTSVYTLKRVTGWASDTLLILQTNDDKGPSFWFDITTKEFTQLSTHF